MRIDLWSYLSLLEIGTKLLGSSGYFIFKFSLVWRCLCTWKRKSTQPRTSNEVPKTGKVFISHRLQEIGRRSCHKNQLKIYENIALFIFYFFIFLWGGGGGGGAYYRSFPQYSRSFFSVTLFRDFNVCKVLSTLEDAATFDLATISTLNLPQ